jgi:hypothetical protein
MWHRFQRFAGDRFWDMDYLIFFIYLSAVVAQQLPGFGKLDLNAGRHNQFKSLVEYLLDDFWGEKF